MTVTIHSILNSVLWGGALSVGLSVLSRNRFVLCRFGVYPLAVLSAACLLRCCLPVELTVTKEVGAAALNRVHKLIDRVASSPAPEFWFFKVWLAGAVLGLVLWLSRYIFRLRAAKRLPISTDSQIQSICKGIGVNGLRIVVTPKAYTPCVIGLWSETILLPDSEYTNRQLENILRHEYAHTKHHDGLLDFILCLLCILFWWNPGVLICRAVIIRLCDHRCDMEALQSVSPSAKRFYCRTLLEFAGRYPGTTRHFAAASLKSRFYLILYGRADAKRVSAILILLLIIVLLVSSYMVIFQPAFQPEEQGYMNYNIYEGMIVKNSDGSYTFHTNRGNFNLSATEAEAIKQEQFPVYNIEGGTSS